MSKKRKITKLGSKKYYSFLLVILACISMFHFCSNNLIFVDFTPSVFNIENRDENIPQSTYGAYLAGRVAHLRKDFNNAADYYVDVLKHDPNNMDLLSRIYVILASKGRISEAAKYAKMSLENGDQNNFTHIIIAVDAMKQGNYDQALASVQKLQGPVYNEFISPLMMAWIYAGKKDSERAIASISILSKEPSFRALYRFHAGMLNDFLGNDTEAQRNYEKIITEDSLEMSFRALQVITNFYIRTNQKDKAIELSNRYNNDQVFTDMLRKLNENVKKSDVSKIQKTISDPNIGMSEALFSIAATLRQSGTGIDLSHVFICLAIYANPNYDLAKILLADILENREMYAYANEVYDEIKPDSESYFSAQIKKSGNLVMIKDYKGAELLLKALAIDFQDNPQLYLDLGDILRLQGKYKEAIKYYNLALQYTPKIENRHWLLFYALATAYDQDKQWENAEINFQKARELSGQHYLVLNYLGYSWLKQGKNIEDAFALIVDAYNQTPYDGNISDSLGWAFYRLGKYEEAIKYLEKASDVEPAAAIIYDHLGDTYWQIGRTNEAVYQWNHALIMKDDSGEVDKEKIKEKIKTGVEPVAPLPFNETIINEKIKTIKD